MVLHAGHSTGAALDPVAPDLKMWTVAPDMPNLYTGAYPTTLSKMNVQVFPPDDNMPWKPEWGIHNNTLTRLLSMSKHGRPLPNVIIQKNPVLEGERVLDEKRCSCKYNGVVANGVLYFTTSYLVFWEQGCMSLAKEYSKLKVTHRGDKLYLQWDSDGKAVLTPAGDRQCGIIKRAIELHADGKKMSSTVPRSIELTLNNLRYSDEVSESDFSPPHKIMSSGRSLLAQRSYSKDISHVLEIIFSEMSQFPLRQHTKLKSTAVHVTRWQTSPLSPANRYRGGFRLLSCRARSASGTLTPFTESQRYITFTPELVSPSSNFNILYQGSFQQLELPHGKSYRVETLILFAPHPEKSGVKVSYYAKLVWMTATDPEKSVADSVKQTCESAVSTLFSAFHETLLEMLLEDQPLSITVSPRDDGQLSVLPAGLSPSPRTEIDYDYPVYNSGPENGVGYYSNPGYTVPPSYQSVLSNNVSFNKPLEDLPDIKREQSIYSPKLTPPVREPSGTDSVKAAEDETTNSNTPLLLGGGLFVIAVLCFLSLRAHGNLTIAQVELSSLESNQPTIIFNQLLQTMLPHRNALLHVKETLQSANSGGLGALPEGDKAEIRRRLRELKKELHEDKPDTSRSSQNDRSETNRKKEEKPTVTSSNSGNKGNRDSYVQRNNGGGGGPPPSHTSQSTCDDDIHDLHAQHQRDLEDIHKGVQSFTLSITSEYESLIARLQLVLILVIVLFFSAIRQLMK